MYAMNEPAPSDTLRRIADLADRIADKLDDLLRDSGAARQNGRDDRPLPMPDADHRPSGLSEH